MKKVMVVFGTRPEAVKLAPVILALRESPWFEPMIAVTAQHREMLDQVLRLFRIQPRFDLDLMRSRQTLTDLTTRALRELSPLLEREAPDAVLVQGDTTTTFVAALAAFFHRIPVVHVEAGLRTFDRYSPFPEEINRRLTTQLTDLHLAPTPRSRSNLLAERVRPEAVVVTGNSVIDALIWAAEQEIQYGDSRLSGLDRDPRRVLLVTAHRRESWGEPMRGIGDALAELAAREPDVLIVFPIHPNPVVREAIGPALRRIPNAVLVDPLAYGSFVRLMKRAHILLTDSGGIQEEGPSLGKPVLVMRDTTERPEAVAAGTARLVGTEPPAIVEAVRTLLHDQDAYSAMANAVNPYGDGHAATRMAAALSYFFGLGPPAEEFQVSGPWQHAAAAAHRVAAHAG